MTSSRRSRAPAASVARGGPSRAGPRPRPPSPGSGRASRARRPGPPGTAPGRGRGRRRGPRAGCVSTTRSIRRSHGGMRASSSRSSRSGSGPPSTSIRAAGPALDEDRVALPDVEHRRGGSPGRRRRPRAMRRERDDDRAPRRPAARAPRDGRDRRAAGASRPACRVAPPGGAGVASRAGVRRAADPAHDRGGRQHQHRGHERRRRTGLGRERDGGERQAGRDPHDRDDHVQQQPGRQPERASPRRPGGRASPGRHRPARGRRRPWPPGRAGRPRG